MKHPKLTQATVERSNPGSVSKTKTLIRIDDDGFLFLEQEGIDGVGFGIEEWMLIRKIVDDMFEA